MSSPASRAQNAFPTLPRGEVIGRYEDYLDAQKVVDYLADNDFPVANVSIIGNDVKVVERVSGKLSYPKVAGQGAMQGASLGVFFGLLLTLFGPSGQVSLVPFFAAILLGAVLFMLLFVLRYALQRGSRDFASTKEFLPATWDVVVAHQVAAQARNLAAQLPMNPRQAGVRNAWGGAPAAQPPIQDPAQGQSQAPGQLSGHQATPTPAAPSPESPYGDLEDGRPRYGVRINQEQPAPAPQPAPEGEKAAETEQKNEEGK